MPPAPAEASGSQLPSTFPLSPLEPWYLDPARQWCDAHVADPSTSVLLDHPGSSETVAPTYNQDVSVKVEVGQAVGPSHVAAATMADSELLPPLKRKRGGRRSRASAIKQEEAAVLSGDVIADSVSTTSVKMETLDEITAGPSTLSTTPTVKGDPDGLPAAKKRKGKAKAEPGPPVEKRMARFRDKCPKNILDRVERVMTQRMYLVDRQKVNEHVYNEEFKVLGSTGNVYTVTIDQRPRCDCPDYLKGNSPCKHIIFVFLKVLKVPELSILWYQKALLVDEVDQVYNAAPSMPSSGSEAVSAKIKNAYLRAMGGDVPEEEVATALEAQASVPGGRKMDSIGEDCPVCYEEMSEKDDTAGRLVYDDAIAGCGKPLHKECFGMWVATAKKKGDQVTCVWCRTPWPVENSGGGKGKGKASSEYTTLGYLNMADMVGMSRQRDTSTYYWGPMAGRRMYEPRYEDE